MFTKVQAIKANVKKMDDTKKNLLRSKAIN
jgi:hypothetical protein